MPEDVDSIVADNRRQIREVGSRFIQVDDSRERFFSFGSSIISVTFEATYRRRSTGSQVIFGHPADSKGFGRGTFGDDKGGWSDEATGEGEFTVAGRRLVAGYVTGNGGGAAAVAFGYGDDPGGVNDTALTELAKTYPTVGRDKPTPATASLSTVVDSTTFVAAPGGETTEAGVTSDSSELLGRATVSTDYGTTDEVRVATSFEFAGDGVGQSSVTDGGEASFADAIHDVGETVDLSQFAIGKTSDQSLGETSTSLNDEVFRVVLNGQTDRNRAVVEGVASGDDAPEGELPFESGEIGVYDSDGRLAWVTKISPTTVDENTEVSLQTVYSIL